MTPDGRPVRLAAVGDLHCPRTPPDVLGPLFVRAAQEADVLILCGDLTDRGLEEEARVLVKTVTASVRIPIVAVLGNHDYESGKEVEITHILRDAGVIVLDGEAAEVHGVGFAGAKGFCGGFGRGALGPWGERTIKLFVQEAVDEALKLEAALARLRTSRRVAVLHYAPIRGTVEGEPVEIFPYLGSSRLEEPINRYRVSVAFHGHAHRGAPEGRTTAGVPVFNVAMPLLARRNPDRPPFLVFELPLEGEGHETPVPPATTTAPPLVKTA